MGIFIQLVFCVLALLLPKMEARTFWMDRKQDCAQPLVEIGRDELITVYAKSGDSLSSQGSCSINFRALDTDAKVEVDFVTFSIQAQGIKMYVIGDGSGSTKTYQEGDSPETFFSTGRAVTITLHKQDIMASAYNFQLRIKATRDVIYPPPNDNNPMAVGLVIGIVGSVFAVIFIVTCLGVCCFRKYRVRGSSGKSPYLYDPDSKANLEENSSHASTGYTNNGVKAGSPASRKKLLHHSSDSSDKSEPDRNARQYKLNLHRNNNRAPQAQGNNRSVPAPPPPPDLKSFEMSPKSGNVIDDRNGRGRDDREDNVFKFDNKDTHKLVNERNVDSAPRPKNPVLNALNSNPKFRNSMAANDRDAEERAKRISSGSSLEGLGLAPTPPSSQDELSRPPKLPAVPKVKQSPKSKHAVIKRAPRPNSVSSDELVKIERGASKPDAERGRRNVQDDSSSSQSEVISINQGDTAKKKFDTTHSLKPDRKSRGRKKQTQSVSSTLDPEPISKQRDEFEREVRPNPRTQRDRILNEEFEKTGSGRYSKRSNRSTPRSSAGKAGKGFSHRRGRSVDQLDSRPTTPTSAYGSMESLPPLVRSSSKTSLYASRTSLYDRRGRRRQGSYSESIASTRDDISVMRHSRGYDEYYSDDDFDGYEKPLSRRDRERIYKSETDIGKNLKEISTQTLRETATQTGLNETVEVKTKFVMKKKKRSKSLSSSGTQTKKSKHGRRKSRGSESDTELKNKSEKVDNGKDTNKTSKSSKGVESDTEHKVKKTKRSKSVDELTAMAEKPKPKPKPRKSTGADTHLDDKVQKSASMENLIGSNPKFSIPQSDGFAAQGMYPGQYYPQMGYPMVPPPGYPGQPGFPPQGQPIQNPYPQPGYVRLPPPAAQQPVINSRKKSNWEMLCDLTDSGYQRDDVTETGSVASSVFTNNPHSVQGYGLPPANQGFYAPPAGYPQQYNYQQQPQNFTNQTPAQVSQQPEKPLNKQSSWDALRGVSASPKQNQEPVPATNGMRRNESVV